jgi:hypothetical protein
MGTTPGVAAVRGAERRVDGVAGRAAPATNACRYSSDIDDQHDSPSRGT